jgi:hypothetical protein
MHHYRKAERICVPSVETILLSIRNNPDSVRFTDAKNVCDYFFGKPRIHGSHHVYNMPWFGDPRISIQNLQGYVHLYQVKQFVLAIDKLEGSNNV